MLVKSPVIIVAVLTAVFTVGTLADPAMRHWSFTTGTKARSKMLEFKKKKKTSIRLYN